LPFRSKLLIVPAACVAARIRPSLRRRLRSHRLMVSFMASRLQDEGCACGKHSLSDELRRDNLENSDSWNANLGLCPVSLPHVQKTRGDSLTQVSPTPPGITFVALERVQGSDLLSLQIYLYQRKRPSTEQIDASAAIHGTFELLQSVNLSFRLSIGPRFQDGIGDCCHVLTAPSAQIAASREC
jgi:hypothetical protein